MKDWQTITASRTLLVSWTVGTVAPFEMVLLLVFLLPKCKKKYLNVLIFSQFILDQLTAQSPNQTEAENLYCWTLNEQDLDFNATEVQKETLMGDPSQFESFSNVIYKIHATCIINLHQTTL